MTSPDSVSASAPRAAPAKRSYSGVGVRLLAVILAAVGALLASNNWCFVLFPAALAAFVADYVVCAIWPRFVLRVAVGVIIGVALGLLLSIGPGWAFREAFGVELPPGVRDVRVWRHYLGGPGEHVLIIEFTADPNAVQALTAMRPSAPESDRLKRWRAAGAEWPAAFDIFVGPGPTSIARMSWMRTGPLNNPELFELGPSNGGSLVLFREPGAGRCVALHVRF
jgi:hypothetical protein